MAVHDRSVTLGLSAAGTHSNLECGSETRKQLKATYNQFLKFKPLFSILEW